MKIRLTESDINRIIKDSIRTIKEDYMSSNAYFQGGGYNDGDFATALYNAYAYADSSNQERLRNAFPDYFPKERMFGNEKEPFDYRDFPDRDSYEKHWKDWKTRN